MGRIVAIDYGKKRTGIAVTDPLQIIATGLTTIPSHELIAFLKKYCVEQEVELFVIGLPLNLDESETHGTALAQSAIERIRKAIPNIPIITADERFTSKMAKQAMLDMGMKKSDRQKKENVDLIAATIILREYMDSKL
jgi:putative holliday junction resolvase